MCVSETLQSHLSELVIKLREALERRKVADG
jgi:hypothetical protein